MKYSIAWSKHLVRVDYSGDIEISDIEDVHFQMGGDARFYDCKFLILNISECNLDKVQVSELFRVIANDIGASKTNRSLKVAMVTAIPDSVEKASEYISHFSAMKSPWQFRILPSLDEAYTWFGLPCPEAD